MPRSPEFSPAPFNPTAIELAGALQATYNSLEHEDFTLEIQQEEAIEALGHALVDGQTSGYFEMATSTGKTLVEALITKAAVAANKRVIILAPKISIAEQIDGRNQVDPSGLAGFTDVHQSTSVGLHFGGSKASPKDQVVISTYAGLLHDAQQGHRGLGEFNVVVGDESHRGLGEKTADVLTNSFPGAIKLGFSATPDFAEDRTSEEIFGKRIYEFSLMDAIDMRKTAPIRALIFETEQELSLYDNRQEFTERELAPFIENKQRNGSAIKLARDFIRDGRQGIIRAIPGYGNLHARILAEQLSKIEGITAAAIGSHLSIDKQRELRREFDRGNIDCLVSTRALGEGWSSTRPSFAINTAPTTSPVETKQSLGRILRKNADGRESIYIDFVDRNTGKVAKQQYTALHALGLETVDSGRVLGRYSQDTRPWTPPTGMPAISEELLARILASEGKLVSDITAAATHRIPPRVHKHWEKVLTKEGLPEELPENIAFDRALDKKFNLGIIAAREALGHEPGLDEIIDHIPMLSRDHLNALAHYGLQLSLEAEDQEALERLADPLEGPDMFLEEALLEERIDEVLATLSEREATVIKARFGLDGNGGMTLVEIGSLPTIQVTREQVRQIESKALTKLRHFPRRRRLEMTEESEEPVKRLPSKQHELYTIYQLKVARALRKAYKDDGVEGVQAYNPEEIEELFTVPGLGLSEAQKIGALLPFFIRLEAEFKRNQQTLNAEKYEIAMSLLERLYGPKAGRAPGKSNLPTPEIKTETASKPEQVSLHEAVTEKEITQEAQITVEQAAELSGWGSSNMKGFVKELKAQGIRVTREVRDNKTVNMVDRNHFGL